MSFNGTEKSMIENAIRFHGHQCPGLAAGIRVSEVVLRELEKPARDEEIVAIVENSSCGVNAIQYLQERNLQEINSDNFLRIGIK